jgi:hypothetical protein
MKKTVQLLLIFIALNLHVNAQSNTIDRNKVMLFFKILYAITVFIIYNSQSTPQ